MVEGFSIQISQKRYDKLDVAYTGFILLGMISLLLEYSKYSIMLSLQIIEEVLNNLLEWPIEPLPIEKKIKQKSGALVNNPTL